MTIKSELGKKIYTLGTRIERTAKKYCPVDTGFMRGKMFFDFNEEDMTLTVGNNAKYSKYIEYGTPNLVAAHGEHDPENPVVQWAAKMKRGAVDNQQMPFLRPAIFEEMSKFREELKTPIRLKVRMVIR